MFFSIVGVKTYVKVKSKTQYFSEFTKERLYIFAALWFIGLSYILIRNSIWMFDFLTEKLSSMIHSWIENKDK